MNDCTQNCMPECMMPDGAEPCEGYKTLLAENGRYRKALNEIGNTAVSDWFGDGKEYADYYRKVAKGALVSTQRAASEMTPEECADELTREGQAMGDYDRGSNQYANPDQSGQKKCKACGYPTYCFDYCEEHQP